MVTAAALLSSTAYVAGADASEIEGLLRRASESYLIANEREDMTALKDACHPESQIVRSVERLQPGLFARYDLKLELLSFRYIGRDGDYAIARGTQNTTKVAGPPGMFGVLDALYVFKQDDGGWKLWQLSVLETKLTKQ